MPSFLDLPPEIRLLIYTYYLSSYKPIIDLQTALEKPTSRPRPSALCRVNRQVNQELSIWTHFTLSIFWPLFEVTATLDFVNCAPPLLQPTLERLRLTIEWKAANPAEQTRSALQDACTLFPKLRSLELKLRTTDWEKFWDEVTPMLEHWERLDWFEIEEFYAQGTLVYKPDEAPGGKKMQERMLAMNERRKKRGYRKVKVLSKVFARVNWRMPIEDGVN